MAASIIITLNRPKSPNSLIPCSSDPLQPVPVIPRFHLLSLSSAFCILYSVFFVPSRLRGQRPPSTLVERALQIAPFYAKQTQFQNGQYKHKYSKNKGLSQRTTNNEQRTLSKTKPIQTQSQPKTRALLDPERSRRANQTQFPQGPPASSVRHLSSVISRPSSVFCPPRPAAGLQLGT